MRGCPANRPQIHWYIVELRSASRAPAIRMSLEQRIESRASLLVPCAKRERDGKTVLEPIVEDYGFISITSRNGTAASILESIRTDAALSREIRFLGTEPMLRRDVEWLSRLIRGGEDAVKDGGPRGIRPGELVKVTSGPLRQFAGVVVSVRKKDAIVRLARFLSRDGVTVKIPVEFLRRDADVRENP